MRQKITYVFKYNLLAALLLAGAMCCAVGVTWCRYQKTIESPVNFIIEGPGSFVILGPDDETKPGVWYEDKATKTTRMDFRVANGVGEEFSEEDGVFRLRLYATEGIPAGAEVTLVVVDEAGIRQTYPISAEQIVFEGKYLELCNEMGDGTRYRFVDGNRELVLKLEGGKQSVLKCSIVVKGDVEPFLAEMQLIDAAYGNEADILTNHVDKVEETPVFLLPEWTAGEEAAETELFLSAQDALVEGKIIVSTESTFVVPCLALTEKEDADEASDASDSGESSDASEASEVNALAEVNDSSESSEENSAGEVMNQELEVTVEPGKVQAVKLILTPNEEVLKEITEPVAANVDVKWAYINEAGEAEELTAKLVIVLNPKKVQLPSEPSAPSSEPSEPSSEPSEPSSESIEPSTESSEASSESSESSSESTEQSSVPSESSSESSEPSTESSEANSESGDSAESSASTENVEDDEATSGEPTEEAIEELIATETFSMLTFEASMETEASEEASSDNASEDASEAETTEVTPATETGTDSSAESENDAKNDATEPSDSSASTDASEPSDSSDSSASTDASEPSDSSDSSASTDASEPSDSSISSESTEPEEEVDVYTFVVKKQNGKHQMALTGLVQKLSLTEMISGQVTYIGEEARTTSQQLQELHIVSHLAAWGFSIPESNLVVETTVEGLTAEGYKKVENSPEPAVTISDVADGDYAGGKYITVQGNNALAGTYRLVLTQKTDDNLVLHTEYIPIFVNYRFEDALKAEAQEE